MKNFSVGFYSFIRKININLCKFSNTNYLVAIKNLKIFKKNTVINTKLFIN